MIVLSKIKNGFEQKYLNSLAIVIEYVNWGILLNIEAIKIISYMY